MPVTIRQCIATDTIPFDLLLLADPSQEQVHAYLDQSVTLLAVDNQVVIGVVVLMALSDSRVEIKNIAVHPDWQGSGIGKRLLQAAIDYARQNRYEILVIGTGNSSIGQLALYQKMGFSMAELWVDYFIEQYPEPIFENGIQCRHMIRLERRLQ